MVGFLSPTHITPLGLLFTAALTTATCHLNFEDRDSLRNIPENNGVSNHKTADGITKSPGRIAGEKQNEKDACPDTILPPGSDQCKIIAEDDGKGGLPVTLCGCNPDYYLYKLPSDRSNPALRICLPCPPGEEINKFAHKDRKCKKKKSNPPSPAPLNATQTASVKVTTPASLLTTPSSLITSQPQHDDTTSLVVSPTPKTEVIQMSPVGIALIVIASVVILLLVLFVVYRKCGKEVISPLFIRYSKGSAQREPTNAPTSNRNDFESNSSGGVRTPSGVPGGTSPDAVTNENEIRSSNRTPSRFVPTSGGLETQQTIISSSDSTTEELQSLLNGDEHLLDTNQPRQSVAQATEEAALLAANDSSDLPVTSENSQQSNNMSATNNGLAAAAESTSLDTSSAPSCLNQNRIKDSSQPRCSNAPRRKDSKLPAISHRTASKYQNQNSPETGMDCTIKHLATSDDVLFHDDSFQLALKRGFTPPRESDHMDPKELFVATLRKGHAEGKINVNDVLEFLAGKNYHQTRLEILKKLFDDGHLKMSSVLWVNSLKMFSDEKFQLRVALSSEKNSDLY